MIGREDFDLGRLARTIRVLIGRDRHLEFALDLKTLGRGKELVGRHGACRECEVRKKRVIHVDLDRVLAPGHGHDPVTDDPLAFKRQQRQRLVQAAEEHGLERFADLEALPVREDAELHLVLVVAHEHRGVRAHGVVEAVRGLGAQDVVSALFERERGARLAGFRAGLDGLLPDQDLGERAVRNRFALEDRHAHLARHGLLLDVGRLDRHVERLARDDHVPGRGYGQTEGTDREEHVRLGRHVLTHEFGPQAQHLLLAELGRIALKGDLAVRIGPRDAPAAVGQEERDVPVRDRLAVVILGDHLPLDLLAAKEDLLRQVEDQLHLLELVPLDREHPRERGAVGPAQVNGVFPGGGERIERDRVVDRSEVAQGQPLGGKRASLGVHHRQLVHRARIKRVLAVLDLPDDRADMDRLPRTIRRAVRIDVPARG